MPERTCLKCGRGPRIHIVSPNAKVLEDHLEISDRFRKCPGDLYIMAELFPDDFDWEYKDGTRN